MDTLATLGYILVSILVVTITLVLFYVKWLLTYWKRKNVPHLEPFFPFGNFGNPITNLLPLGIQFQKSYKMLKKMGAKYGGFYAYCVPGFMPIHPEYIKLLLVKEFKHFQGRGMYHNEKQRISANLVILEGEKWRSLRVKFTPTFTSAKIKTMFRLMVACCNTMETYIKEHVSDNNALDVKPFMGNLTSNIIASCAFGIDRNSFEDTEFIELLMGLVVDFTGFWKFTFCTALPKLAKSLGIVSLSPKRVSIVVNMINETINLRIKSNVKRNDFLQINLELMEQDLIDMDEIRAQCLLFMLAGYETTSTALTYVLFELASNQDIQEKLRREIREVLAEHGDTPTYEAIDQMNYLKMVVYETLRKYPPIPILTRKCNEDLRLPDSDVVIEKGMDIVIPVLGLHYDPEYFPNPEKFDPERFSEVNKDSLVPYTYLPFGEGPRNCIADRFGKLQLRIATAMLIRKFKFTLNSRMKLPLEFATHTVIYTTKQDILLNVQSLHE